MRRIITLTLAALLALSLTACGGPSASKDAPENTGVEPKETTMEQEETGTEQEAFPVTMRDLVDANMTEPLVEKYGGVLAEMDYRPGMYTEGFLTALYTDGEIRFAVSGADAELYMEDGHYVLWDGNYGAPLVEELADVSDLFRNLAMNTDSTVTEEIQEVAEDGDTLTVRTLMSVEDTRIYSEGSVNYQEGDRWQEEYVLAADDLRLLSGTTSIIRANGTVDVVRTSSVTYGAAHPEEADIMLEHMRSEDSRTVTLVLDPGTAEERTISAAVMRGDSVFPVLPEGYTAFYADAACTTPYESGDGQSDVTMYTRYEE